MRCLHEAIVAAIGRATDRGDRSCRPIAKAIAWCKHRINDIVGYNRLKLYLKIYTSKMKSCVTPLLNLS